MLLIVAALDDDKLKSLLELAHSLNMTVLVETHTREEIQRAINAGARVIGINARNLKDFKVDVNKYNELARRFAGRCDPRSGIWSVRIGGT